MNTSPSVPYSTGWEYAELVSTYTIEYSLSGRGGWSRERPTASSGRGVYEQWAPTFWWKGPVGSVEERTSAELDVVGLLNEVGAQNWELVAVASEHWSVGPHYDRVRYTTTRYLLKRRLAAGVNPQGNAEIAHSP